MKKISLQELLSKYEKLLFVFGGMILVLIGCFFIVPKTKEIFELRNDISREKNRLKKLELKLADLETLNDFELQERVDLSLKAIPTQKNVVATMTNLRAQAKETGVVIKNLQVSPGEIQASASAKPGKGSFDFKIEITGSFESLLNFFKKIENSLPLVSLNNVKIEILKESIVADFILKSYFMPLPQTLGAVDSPIPKLTSSEEKILGEISKYTFLPPVNFFSSGGRENPFSF